MRVLLTGMSGSGKSTLVQELRRLTVPAAEIVTRLTTRSSNLYGQNPVERRRVVADRLL